VNGLSIIFSNLLFILEIKKVWRYAKGDTKTHFNAQNYNLCSFLR
jgi:hypothetical protein